MSAHVDGVGKPGTLGLAVGAGLAGGMAEIVWIALVASQTGGGAEEVARQVTATVITGTAALAIAPFAGVAIHMLLSVLLAVAFWQFFWRPYASEMTPFEAGLFGMGSLAAVWLVNFTAVLPVLNPAFITVVPLWATLVSKLLFGTAMTAVLLTPRYERRARLPADHACGVRVVIGH